MAIGWSTAFEKAIAYTVYSIVWDFVGLGLIGLSFYLGGVKSLFGSFTLFQIMLMIIGAIIIFFGNTASFFKVLGDTVASAVEAKFIEDEESEEKAT